MSNIFTNFKDSKEVNNSIIKFGSQNFDSIIESAKKCDPDAITFLMYKNLQAIIYSFEVYNKKLNKCLYENLNDERVDFISNFYVKLIESTQRGKGPIYSFRKEVYDNQEDYFLMQKFGYRMFRYGEYVILTRYRGKRKIRRIEYCVSTDYDAQHSDFTYKEESAFDNIEDPNVVKDIPEEFIDFLRKKENKSMYEIFTSIMEGQTVAMIAKAKGKSRECIYQYIRQMKVLYQKF
jgi:hypothetical protein